MFPTNKQSFLAELNSLLSFMQESDRRTAVSMYSKMFDDAPDEQELLSYLVSPTRQAIKLARVYDPSSESESGHAEFIDEISSSQVVPSDSEYSNPPLDNQTSLFKEQNVSAPVSKPSRRRQAWKDESYQQSGSPVRQDVDAFISGIKVNDEISAAESVRTQTCDDLNLDFPAAEAEPDVSAAKPASVIAAAADTSADEPLNDAVRQTVTKTNVPLLILYTIFAIPVTSLIIVLVIVLALSFLGIAAASGYAGFLLITSAFGGFAVFADIMVVLGVSLVLIALAILFMWIFIWLLGGVVVASVKGAINLGGRLCVREVEV